MATVTHAVTALWNTTTGTATNKNVTATPAASDLIVVIAGSTGLAGGTTAVTDNNADGLGTYTQVDTDRTGFSTTGVLNIWVRNALIGSATSTVFTAAQNGSSGGGLDVFRISGMSLTGATAVRQAAGQSSGTSSTTPAPAMGGAVLTGNPVIGAVANGTSAATLTPRTSYTEATDLGYSTPTTGLETMFRSSGETGTTITWGSTSGSTFASVAIELDTSVPEDSSALELSGFGAGTLVHSYDTINSVKVSYTHHETAGTLAPTLQLWDGTSSQIGATFTCTTSTTDVTDTAVFTGVSYSQLATLRVRVFAHGTTGHVESADAAGIVVNFTAGTPPVSSLVSPQPPAWHPAGGPSVPGGVAFEAWPAWEGAAVPAGPVTVTGTATAAGAGSVTALATQIAPASAAAAGTVTAAATVTALASQAVSLTGPDVLPGLPGGVAFEAWPAWEGAAVPAGPVTVTGTATAAGAGSVTAVVTEIPAASAAGAGSVTALATQIAPATAAGAASVSDVVTQIAGAAAAGAGSVTAAGSSSGAATATSAGAGATTAVVTQIAPATAAGAGAVTTAATQAAGATAAGAGSVTALATQIAPATAAGAASVSDVVTQIAGASAAGAGSVTAAGSVIGGGNTASAAGAGSVTAKATQIAPAAAAGAASVTDVATQIAKAAAAGAGAAAAAGQITGTANVAGAGATAARAAQAPVASAAGAGALSALATQQAIAAITGSGSVTASGVIQLAFTVGTLTAADAPLAVLGASSATAGTATLTASDTRTGGPGG